MYYDNIQHNSNGFITVLIMTLHYLAKLHTVNIQTDIGVSSSSSSITPHIHISSEITRGNKNVYDTFLPSSSCVPCANTLSTLAGSAKVINPKPL